MSTILVDQINQKTTELIDLCEQMRVPDQKPPARGKVQRLIDFAQKDYEKAAMWAVKAATG